MKTNSENLIKVSFRISREEMEFIRFLNSRLHGKKSSSIVLRALIDDYMLGYIESGSFTIERIKNED